jgi:hypothetical protein
MQKKSTPITSIDESIAKLKKDLAKAEARKQTLIAKSDESFQTKQWDDYYTRNGTETLLREAIDP